MIELEVARLERNPSARMVFFVLREKNGNRCFPPIGIPIEYLGLLQLKLKGGSYPHALIHDIVGRVIRAVGARIAYGLMTELKNNIIYANLLLDFNGEEIPIECSLGDALILCLDAKVPFCCKEEILAETGLIINQEGRITKVDELQIIESRKNKPLTEEEKKGFSAFIQAFEKDEGGEK